MNVTRDEAAEALAAIGKAGDKVTRLQSYHDGALHFILWGLVWLAANTVTQFWPDYVNTAWIIGIGFAITVSAIMAVIQARRAKHTARSALEKQASWRMAATCAVVLAYIACMMMIAQPATQRMSNALISIIFAFLYMAGGVWGGWRLFAIGVVTLVAIIVGYYHVKEYFALWMGVVAGGSLIAGGVWLRTA